MGLKRGEVLILEGASGGGDCDMGRRDGVGGAMADMDRTEAPMGNRTEQREGKEGLRHVTQDTGRGRMGKSTHRMETNERRKERGKGSGQGEMG
jgi:hypothetical protein